MEIITKNAPETKRFGQKIGSSLKGGKVLALSGDLGSGKTTFVQGLARGLGIKTRIISPTFILTRQYEVKGKKQQAISNRQKSKVTNFYHMDLYRLEGNIQNEVRNLGLMETWENPQNVVVIEWAEKIRSMIPETAVWIKFENLGGERRKLILLRPAKRGFGGQAIGN